MYIYCIGGKTGGLKKQIIITTKHCIILVDTKEGGVWEMYFFICLFANHGSSSGIMFHFKNRLAAKRIMVVFFFLPQPHPAVRRCWFVLRYDNWPEDLQAGLWKRRRSCEFLNVQPGLISPHPACRQIQQLQLCWVLGEPRDPFCSPLHFKEAANFALIWMRAFLKLTQF